MKLNHPQPRKLSIESPKGIGPSEKGVHVLKRIFLMGCVVILASATSAWAQTIKVASPKGGTQAAPLPSTGGARLLLKFTVSDAVATPKVRIVDDAVIANGYGDYAVVSGSAEQKVTLNLLKGKNKITLFGYVGDASNINLTSSPQATIWITCDDECGKAKDLIVSGTQEGGSSGGTGSQTTSSSGGNITFKSQAAMLLRGRLIHLFW